MRCRNLESGGALDWLKLKLREAGDPMNPVWQEKKDSTLRGEGDRGSIGAVELAFNAVTKIVQCVWETFERAMGNGRERKSKGRNHYSSSWVLLMNRVLPADDLFRRRGQAFSAKINLLDPEILSLLELEA